MKPVTRLAYLSSVFFAYYLPDSREPLDASINVAARYCRERKKKKERNRDEG